MGGGVGDPSLGLIRAPRLPHCERPMADKIARPSRYPVGHTGLGVSTIDKTVDYVIPMCGRPPHEREMDPYPIRTLRASTSSISSSLVRLTSGCSFYSSAVSS